MERPSGTHRAYWRLEDNEKQVTDLAKKVLLYYIQSNYDTNRDRLEALQSAAEWVGFKVEIVENNGEFVFKVPDVQTPLFDEMRQKIRTIRRWSFEGETVQIVEILKEYKQKVPKWFWQKWPKVQEEEKKSFKFL